MRDFQDDPRLVADDLLVTHLLESRPRRAPDHIAEIRAMHELAQLMATNDAALLERTAALARELCQAGSAGVSVPERGADGRVFFRWLGVAGGLAPIAGGLAPLDETPCGLCLEKGEPILVHDPSRAFPRLKDAPVELIESLIAPLPGEGGAVLGTIWIVSHDPGRQFDATDAGVVTRLAAFAAVGLKVSGLLREANKDAAAALAAAEAEITERRRAETALQETAGRLRAELAAGERLQEASTRLIPEGDMAALFAEVVSAAIAVTGADFCTVQMLDEAEGALRMIAAHGMPEHALQDFQTVRPTTRSSCGVCLREGGRGRVVIEDYETDPRMRGEDGRAHLVAGIRSAISTPLVARSGRLVGMLSTHWRVARAPNERDLRLLDVLARQAADLIERKLADDQRELLIDELNHRVKNTLATVQSIVSQGLRGADTPKGVRDSLEGRIFALAAAHDLLTREKWTTTALPDVVSQATRAFTGAAERLDLRLMPARLRPATALALSMALHELTTNAIRYGALSAEGGRVRIVAETDGAELVLTWRERGGPQVAPPRRSGFGSRLIAFGLAHQLGAAVRLSHEPAGVECEVRIPRRDRGEF